MKRLSIVILSSGFLSLFIFLFIQSCKPVYIQGPNRKPIARAGFDRQAEVHERVMFDGSGSFDPDDDALTYEWSLLSRPQSGRAELNGIRGMKTCSITPDASGTWMVALTVYDKKLISTRDVVRLMVSDPEPPITSPDLEVSDVRVFGQTIDNKKYIQIIQAKVKNNGVGWTDPLSFRVLAMDQLIGGHFTFDQTASVNSICLLPGDAKWYTLIYDRIEWPQASSNITFGVKVDPENTIVESNENNNLGETTKDRNTLMEEPPEVFYPKPDIAISNFSAKGIYQDKYVNHAKVQIKNNKKKYNGPMKIKFTATEGSHVLLSKVISFDNICMSPNDKKWIDLSRREIEIPEPLSTKIKPLAASINYFVDADFWNQVDETDEENNTESFKPLIMDLLPQCNVAIFEEIRVRDSNARITKLKNGGFFSFDCERSNEFDFYITMQNYCKNNNSVELYIVFDWTHLKADGKNINIKKGHQVNFPYAGQMEITLNDLKIPTNGEFLNDFSPFAILAHHDKGYDVLFSAYVEVTK